MWYVYILQAGDGRLYTGCTTDLQRRMAQHRAGQGAAFTRAFGAEALLYREDCPTRSRALRREAAIKRLSREEKLSLIAAGSDRGDAAS